MSPSKRTPRPRCGTAQDNPRRDRFVQEYLKLGNATEAAKKAGYSPTTAHTTGCRLLKDDYVRAKIETLRSKVEEKASVSLAEVVEAIRELAFLDPAELYDENGVLKQLQDMPVQARRAIAKLKTTTYNEGSGDGVQEKVKELWLVDKTKPMDMLMRHLGGYQKDKVEVSLSGDMVELLLQGRQRARERGKAS